MPTYCFNGRATKYPFATVGTPRLLYQFDGSARSSCGGTGTDGRTANGTQSYQTGRADQCQYFNGSTWFSVAVGCVGCAGCIGV